MNNQHQQLQKFKEESTLQNTLNNQQQQSQQINNSNSNFIPHPSMTTSLPPGAGKNLGLSNAQISNSVANLDSMNITMNYSEQQQLSGESNINSNVSNSTFNPNQHPTSPKEQKHQQQPHQPPNPNLQNLTTSMRSNSISNLAQSTGTVSSSTSTSNILDQTTASISELITGQDTNSEEKKSIDDKGIKSRIELAMDLVKSHLTSAVNQEIVFLKNQINQLQEKCSRLEKENQILKKNASPDTLELLLEPIAPSSTTSRSRDPSNVISSSTNIQHNPAKQNK